MEKHQTAPTEQTQETTSIEQNNQEIKNEETQEQKPNDITALERKNRELLGLLKKYKSELGELKKIVEETKQQELEKQGRYGDLYKQAQEELQRTKQILEQERENFKLEKIKSEIARKAIEKGAVDVNLVFRLLDKDDFQIVEFDESGAINENAIEAVLNMAQQKTKIDLFKKGIPAKVGAISSSSAIGSQAIDTKKMSLNELKELYKKIK